MENGARLKSQEVQQTDEAIFAQFGLREVNESPFHVGVLSKDLGKTSDGMNEALMGMKRGSHFYPESHAHGHVLTIKHGFGIISINGDPRLYHTGDVFDIPGNIPHGFLQVKETTIVTQKY